MAKYVLCKGCKKFIEYKPVTRIEYGNHYVELECPLCGHKDVQSNPVVSPMFLEGRIK